MLTYPIPVCSSHERRHYHHRFGAHRSRTRTRGMRVTPALSRRLPSLPRQPVANTAVARLILSPSCPMILVCNSLADKSRICRVLMCHTNMSTVLEATSSTPQCRLSVSNHFQAGETCTSTVLYPCCRCYCFVRNPKIDRSAHRM